MTPTVSNLKRRAKAVGIRFRRSTWRGHSIDNRGGFQMVDTSTSTIIARGRFNTDLGDVAEVIAREEARP